MTDKTPERIWVSEIPWDLGKSGALDALGFAWSIAHGKNPTEFVRADIHAAVVAERDNAIDRADATERAFGELASKVPLPDVIRATGTVGDFAAWFCEVVAERDQLEEAVNELLIVWQNDGSVADLDLVKLHAAIKSIETSRTELEKHRA